MSSVTASEIELILLGTGCAVVTECYNTCFVLKKGNDCFLVDGGGGSQILSQLKKAKIEPSHIRSVFVTHKHIDHLLGILWVIRILVSQAKRERFSSKVMLYGHAEVIALLKQMCEELLHQKVEEMICFQVVEDREKVKILGQSVTFFDVHSTKAKQFGFCMELGEGKKLTCLGDEPYNESEFLYAKDSTWLLHEAFCLHAEEELFHPYQKHHSTVKDACMHAEMLKAENLVLYHTEDTHMKQRKQLYTDEGMRYYHGNLYVPEDLERILLSGK